MAGSINQESLESATYQLLLFLTTLLYVYVPTASSSMQHVQAALEDRFVRAAQDIGDLTSYYHDLTSMINDLLSLLRFMTTSDYCTAAEVILSASYRDFQKR